MGLSLYGDTMWVTITGQTSHNAKFVLITGKVTVHHMHGYPIWCFSDWQNPSPIRRPLRQQTAAMQVNYDDFLVTFVHMLLTSFVSNNSMQRSKTKHKMQKMKSIFKNHAKDEVRFHGLLYR